jgi:hypothetical protein
MFTRGVATLTTTAQVLADPPPNGAPSNSCNSWLAWVAPAATVLAAVVAAIAAGIAAFMAYKTASHQRQRDKTDREIDYRRQQLNELYGRLYMLRLTSKRLYDVLREQMDVAPVEHEQWRLVDHIQDIQSSQKELAKSSVIKILDINAEIETLLKEKWGLLETYPPHQTFTQFMSHSALLQQAWEKGVNQASTSRTVFPRTIDDDIDKDMQVIRAKLNELTSK